MGLNLGNVTESISLSFTEVYSIIEKYIINYWQNYINSIQIKHVSKTVRLSHPTYYSKKIKIDKSITRLRLGTSLLPGSAGQFVKNIDPHCSQCRVTDMIYITYCLSAPSLMREMLFGTWIWHGKYFKPKPLKSNIIYGIVTVTPYR